MILAGGGLADCGKNGIWRRTEEREEKEEGRKEMTADAYR